MLVVLPFVKPASGPWKITTAARNLAPLGDEYTAASVELNRGVTSRGDVDKALARFAEAQAEIQKKAPAEMARATERAIQVVAQAETVKAAR